MNTAIIIAGGVGSRMGQEIPKQFLTVNEIPLIIYTLKAFQKHENTDRIVVACLAGWEEALKAYCRQFSITKLEAVIAAGVTRFESICNGIKYLKKSAASSDLITLHDANRPLIFGEIIDRNQKIAREYGNALTVIPCNDAMFVSYDRITADEHIDKKILFQGQTPETFKFNVIDDICKKAIADKAGDLSISALLLKYNYDVFLSEGSPLNFKITTSENMDIFKTLANNACC